MAHGLLTFSFYVFFLGGLRTEGFCFLSNSSDASSFFHLSRMMAHAVELLTAGSTHAEILLHEEQSKLGGISIEELHKLVYAQVLSSHAFTWQVCVDASLSN